MKTILFLTALFGGNVALAAPEAVETKTTMLSERTVVIPAEINEMNVKLSRADYSVPVVKILVPSLADVTALNHRNTKEGAPCLATYDTKNPIDIIQGNPQSENITLTIKLEKHTTPILETGICEVTLSETIEGVIRGRKFTHERFAALPERKIEDCR